MRIDLQRGQVLTVSTDAVSAATIRRLANSGDSTAYSPAEIGASETISVGPFTQPRNYEVLATAGSFSHAVTTPNEDDVTGNSASVITCQPTTIANGRAVSIPADSQAAIFTALTVLGRLTINGTLRVGSWPS